MLFNIGIAQI